MQPSPLTIKNIYGKFNELEEYLSDAETRNYEICPFTIILGAVNTTERGYKNLYSIPTDYTSFSKVFTGDEALIAVWDNSYKIHKQENPNEGSTDPNDYYGTKIFQIGTIFKGLLLRDNITLNFTPSAQNSGFTQEQMTKNVTIIVKNDEQNKVLFNNLSSYFFKLFMIPRLNIFIDPIDGKSKNHVPNEANPTVNVDKQWYYLASVNKVWERNKRRIAYIMMEFSSLNDKLSTSGLAINQYVQTGGPGEKCALPTISEDNDDIILNHEFLHFLPITHIQITFYGSVAFSSVVFFGRTIKNEDDILLLEKITPPHLLFPYNFQAPIYDRLSLKGIAQNDYYIVWGCLTIDSYFNDWRTQIAAEQLFDETNKKEFEGHFRSTKSITRNTNPTQQEGTPKYSNDPDDDPNYFNQKKHKPYWSPVAFANLNAADYDQEFNISGNQYFQYTDADDHTIVIPQFKGNESHFKFNYKDIPSSNLNQFNNLNMFSHFLNNTMYQLPIDVRETTSITLNSLPIVGSFLNRLFGGLSVGFKKTIAEYSNAPSFFSLMNCSNYDSIVDTLYAISTKTADNITRYIPIKTQNNTYNGIIPLNVFDNSENQIASLLGTASTANAFVFDLTDRISTVRYNHRTKLTDGLTYLTNTVNLNQKINDVDDEGNPLADKYIYLVDKLTKLEQTDPTERGFIIDGMSLKVLGKCKYRIDFFSNLNDETKPINYDYCVYSATYQTLSSITNNVRLWTENKTFTNPFFKFNESFRFPQAIIPPNPEDADSIIIRKRINIPFVIEEDVISTIKNKWSVGGYKPAASYIKRFTHESTAPTNNQLDFTIEIDKYDDYEVSGITIETNSIKFKEKLNFTNIKNDNGHTYEFNTFSSINGNTWEVGGKGPCGSGNTTFLYPNTLIEAQVIKGNKSGNIFSFNFNSNTVQTKPNNITTSQVRICQMANWFDTYHRGKAGLRLETTAFGLSGCTEPQIINQTNSFRDEDFRGSGNYVQFNSSFNFKIELTENPNGGLLLSGTTSSRTIHISNFSILVQGVYQNNPPIAPNTVYHNTLRDITVELTNSGIDLMLESIIITYKKKT